MTHDKAIADAFGYLGDPDFTKPAMFDYLDGILRGLEVRFWMFLLRVPEADRHNVMISFRYRGYDRLGSGGRWLSYRLGFMKVTGVGWEL